MADADLGTLKARITGDTSGLDNAKRRAKSIMRDIDENLDKRARSIRNGPLRLLSVGFLEFAGTLRRTLSGAVGAVGRAIGNVLSNVRRFFARIRVLAAAAGVAAGAILALRQEITALGVAIGGVAERIVLEPARKRLASVGATAKQVREQLDLLRVVSSEFGERVTALAGGFSKLVARGKEAGFEMEQIRTILVGAVKSGNAFGRAGKDINDTLATFSELAQQNRVSLQDLKGALEFTNDPLQVLSNALGKSEERVKALIEANATLSNQSLVLVAQQLRDQSEASNSLSGAFNRLFNTVTELLDVFNRTGVIDAMIDVMDELRRSLQTQGIVDAIRQLARATAEWIRGLPETVRAVRENWGSILRFLRTTIGALVGIGVGGPVGGIIGAVVGGNKELRESFFETLGDIKDFAFNVSQALEGVQVGGNAQAFAEWLQRLETSLSGLIKKIKEGRFEAALSQIKDDFVAGFKEILQTAVADAILQGITNGFSAAAKEVATFSPLAFVVNETERVSNKFGGSGSSTGSNRQTGLNRQQEAGTEAFERAAERRAQAVEDAQKRIEEAQEAINEVLTPPPDIDTSGTVADEFKKGYEEFIGVMASVRSDSNETVESVTQDQKNLAESIKDELTPEVETLKNRIEEIKNLPDDILPADLKNEKLQNLRLEKAKKELEDFNNTIDRLFTNPREARTGIEGIDEAGDALGNVAEKAKEATKESKESADRTAQAFEDAATDINNAFTDTFRDIFDNGIDGFEGFVDRIEDIFKDLLAQLATQAIANPIIIPAVQEIGSGLGVGQGPLNQITSQLGGVPGGGGFGIGDSINNFGQSIGFGGGAAGRAAGGAPQLLGRGGGGFTSSTLTGTLGAAGLGFGVGQLLTGTQEGGVGGGLGAGAGFAFGGPIGGVIGGLAGSALGGLFGDSEPDDADIFASLGQSGRFSDSNFRQGQFTSSGPLNIRQDTGGVLGSEQRSQIEAAITQRLEGGFNALDEAFRKSTGNALSSLSASTQINDGQDLISEEEGVTQAVQRIASDLLEGISSDLPGTIADIFEPSQGLEIRGRRGRQQRVTQIDPERAEAGLQALQRLAQVGELDRLDEITAGADDAVQAINQFAQATQSVDQFLRQTATGAERIEFLREPVEQFNEAIDRSGENLIDTIPELREFVKGLDLTTESGRQSAQQALQFAEAIRQFADATGSAGEAISRAAQQAREARAEFLRRDESPEDAVRRLNREIAQDSQFKRGSFIRSQSAVNQFVEGLDLTTEAGREAFETARDLASALRDMARAEEDATQQAERRESEAIRGVVDARQTLIEQLEQEREEAERTAEDFASVADRLNSFRQSLQFGPDSTNTPQQQVEAARSQFEEVRARALGQGGVSQEDQLAAQQRLPDVAGRFLEEARGFFASGQGFQNASMLVERTLESAEVQAQSQEDLLRDQLQTLDVQVQAQRDSINAIADTTDAVDRLRDPIDSVADAVDRVREAINSAPSGVQAGSGTQSDGGVGGSDRSLRQQLIAAAGEDGFLRTTQRGSRVGTAFLRQAPDDVITQIAEQAPGFASGGLAGPGLARVGENGPELVNFPQPAEVISRGNGNDEATAQEVRALREEVRLLRQATVVSGEQVTEAVQDGNKSLRNQERKARLDTTGAN